MVQVRRYVYVANSWVVKFLTVNFKTVFEPVDNSISERFSVSDKAALFFLNQNLN